MSFLNQIMPFNKYFYYNCFHSCLFSIIEANEGDVRKVMISGIPHLVINENKQQLYTRFDFMEDYGHLLEEQGLKVERQDKLDDSGKINFAVSRLKEDKPVIISVDCFELPYMEDLYHKQKWPHSILLTGYIEERDSIRVIDIPSRDATIFQKYEMSLSDLEKAVVCYSAMLVNNNMYSDDRVYSFEKKGSGKKYKDTELLEAWNTNRKKAEEKILEGIYGAEDYFNKMLPCLTDTDFCTDYGEMIIDGLNDIVKQIGWENQLISEILSNENKKYLLHSELMQSWINLRKKIALVIMSSRHRDKGVNSIEILANRIIFLEKQLLSF